MNNHVPLLETCKKLKELEDFPNYSVDTEGNVYSKKRSGSKGGKLKPFNARHGYQGVQLWKNNECTTSLVHRLVAQAFIPNPKNKPQVNHKDGDKTNNKVNNLERCTYQENRKHAVEELGLSFKGELNYNAKLNKQSVEDIRKRKGKQYAKDVAAIYGISRQWVNEIWKGAVWA